jgi:serine/threonine-protein kinase HipA
MALTTDKHAVIWTRTKDGPLKMADMIVTPKQTRFSYTHEFIEYDAAYGAKHLAGGVSLLAPPQQYKTEQVTYLAKDSVPLYPRLMSMLPARNETNIQRRLYTRILEKREQPPKPGLDTDWEILLLSAHNGIGHLDVFRDDRVAEHYYHDPEQRHLLTSRSAYWKQIQAEIQNTVYDIDEKELLDAFGPTPSVGGMIPKILVAIPDTADWKGEFASPGTRKVDGTRYIDVILKVEPMGYEGVLALEALCLEVHRELGFEVPQFWSTAIDGMRVLAIKRFDRSSDGYPIPMESFFSVFAIGDKYFQSNQDTDLEEMAHRIARLGKVANLDVRATQQELYRRIIVALFTGNGDLHLENLSFLGGAEDVRLSPVYDPAPMRAWSRHNTRFAIPLVFDDDIGGLKANLIQLGSAYQYTRKQAEALIEEIADKTKNYTARVDLQTNVPEHNKHLLIETINKEREILGVAIS